MTRAEYITHLTNLLSGDPKLVREANAELYAECVDEPSEAAQPPVLALAEADQRLAMAT